MAKVITKRTKLRLIFIGIPCLFIMGYTVFLGLSYYITIQKLSAQEAELKHILSELKKDEKELKNDIKKLKDPEYIAKYAREHFLYSKEGEYVIKIEDDNLVVEETESSKKDTYKKAGIITACILGGIFLLAVLFSKRKKEEE